MRLRTAITKATAYRIKENNSIDEKINLLRGDIINAPSHVFGEHAKCKSINYFKCENNLSEKNLIPAMKDCGIYEDIMVSLQRLIDNASSLILNMDNNLAEHYNSVVCKFVGGKRVNYSLRGSYQTRCEAAALSFNSKGDYYRNINKTATGKSPSHFTKKHVFKCQKNIARNVKKRLFLKKFNKKKKEVLPDKDYGPEANYIPMEIESDQFMEKAEDFLEKLKKTPEEIQELERSTVGQSANPKWIQEWSLRITASNFGQICKMRPQTSCLKTVQNLLYGNFHGNKATRYGIESEAHAIAEFQNTFNVKVSQCGLYIGHTNYYLGASPDGLIIESNSLIEIKCPYVISKMPPTKGIEERKIKFAELIFNKLHLKRNHNYYYQIQGQLALANKQMCYFVVWSPHGMLVEEVSLFLTCKKRIGLGLGSAYHISVI